MKILGLHHVAIATDDLKSLSKNFDNLFGLKCGEAETSPDGKISLSFLDLGNTDLEFLQPLDKESAISKFLEKRGSGIHHICLLVESIEKALAELRAKNIQLIDDKPRRGAGGSLIAFIHPAATGGILIELKENKF
jgi:methylmalonyl-CoA/ethylmalonyl-CoA epimerase